eukprot:TRINITY_DN923_c0_g1_i2.p1 TRINITY_DN923_c0_g1~~TRINITY_DN923_c0_g1_i2.p1  ORF type:complete len:2049 (-),score=477.04 TRINITY_DN923_c0_g1_i2:42-6188(-)
MSSTDDTLGLDLDELLLAKIQNKLTARTHRDEDASDSSEKKHVPTEAPIVEENEDEQPIFEIGDSDEDHEVGGLDFLDGMDLSSESNRESSDIPPPLSIPTSARSSSRTPRLSPRSPGRVLPPPPVGPYASASPRGPLPSPRGPGSPPPRRPVPVTPRGRSSTPKLAGENPEIQSTKSDADIPDIFGDLALDSSRGKSAANTPRDDSDPESPSSEDRLTSSGHVAPAIVIPGNDEESSELSEVSEKSPEESNPKTRMISLPGSKDKRRHTERARRRSKTRSKNSKTAPKVSTPQIQLGSQRGPNGSSPRSKHARRYSAAPLPNFMERDNQDNIVSGDVAATPVLGSLKNLPLRGVSDPELSVPMSVRVGGDGQRPAQFTGGKHIVIPYNELKNQDWWTYPSKEDAYEKDILTSNSTLPSGLPEFATNAVVPKVDFKVEHSLRAWKGNFDEISIAPPAAATSEELYALPKDDVTVRMLYHESAMLEFLDISADFKVGFHVRAVYDYCTRHYPLVLYRYEKYGGTVPFSEKMRLFLNYKKKQLGEPVVENSKGSSRTRSTAPKESSTDSAPILISAPPDLDPSLCGPPTAAEIATDLQLRNEGKKELASTYQLPQINDVPAFVRIHGKPFPSYSKKLFFMINGIDFEFEGREDFQVMFTLYDVEKKQRLTESFYYEYTDRSIRPNPYIDLESTSTTVLIDMPYVSEHIYVIAILYRVLKGDVDTVCDPYMKGASMSDKAKRKWLDENSETTRVFKDYKQAFAFCAAPVYDSEGHCLFSTKPSKLKIFKMKPYLSDEAIYDLPFDVLNEGKKFKLLDGHLKLAATPYSKGMTISRLYDRNLNPYLSSKKDRYATASRKGDVAPKVSKLTESEREDLKAQMALVSQNLVLLDLGYFPFVDCFSGKHLIEVMVQQGLASSAELAIPIASKLVAEEFIFVANPNIPEEDEDEQEEASKFTDKIYYHLPEGHAAQQLSYVRVKDKVVASEDGFAPDNVKTVQNFAVSWLPPTPTTEFMNNLFIHPKHVNLEKYPATKDLPRVKTIQCRFSILSTESIVVEEHARSDIYGHANMKNFVNVAAMACQPNQKRTQFAQEIKVKLPLQVHPKYHILVQVLNVNMKPKKDVPVEQILGYAALPLVTENGLLIEDKEYTIPLLIPGYAKKVPDGPSITIATKLFSSLFTQNSVLHTFLQCGEEGVFEVKKATIEALDKVPSRELIRLFPIIADRLFLVIGRDKSNNIQQLAWRALINIVKIVDAGTASKKSRDKPNPILADLLTHYVKDYNPTGKYEELHDSILRHWLTLTNEAGLDPHVQILRDLTMNSFSWFYFGIIAKSMTIAIQRRGLMHDDDRKKRFSMSSRDTLSKLAQNFHSLVENDRVTTQFNENYSYFLLTLGPLHERNFVLQLISDYHHAFLRHPTSTSLEHLLRFHNIISSYEHFVPLNQPYVTKVSTIKFLQKQLWQQHFLVGIMIDALEKACTFSLGEEENPIRLKAIQNLFECMWGLGVDLRYCDQLENIGTMFLPLIQVALKYYETFTDGGPTEQRYWAACILWVLRYGDPTGLREYLSLETNQRLILLFDLLTFSVDLFREEKKDCAFFSQLVLVSLEVIDYFIIDSAQKLYKEANLDLFENVCGYVLLLLKTAPKDILRRVLFTVRKFVFTFTSPIFRLSTSGWGHEVVTNLLMRSYSDSSIATDCVHLIYAFLKANWAEMGEFLRMKLFLTLAVGKVPMEDLKVLPFILDAFVTTAKQDPDAPSGWVLHVKDIFGRLFRACHYMLQLDVTKDLELKTEIMHNLSREMNHSVNMRIFWLNKLAAFYKEGSYLEEMAQCKIFIAALISLYLNIKSGGDSSYLPQNFLAFSHSAPNIKNELPVRSLSVIESVSPILSEEGYVKTLHEAVNALVEGDAYELGVEILSMMFQLHKDTGQFRALIPVGTQLAELAEKAAVSSEGNTRLFSNYYRCGFYGKRFGPLHEKEYIYRQAASLRLVDFQNQMLLQFSSALNVEVKTIPNKPFATLLEAGKVPLPLALRPFTLPDSVLSIPFDLFLFLLRFSNSC